VDLQLQSKGIYFELYMSVGLYQKGLEVDVVMTETVSAHFPCLTGNLQEKFAFLAPKSSLHDHNPMKTLRFIRNSLKN